MRGQVSAKNQERETFPVESSDGQNLKNQEDYLTMVYGDFLESGNPRLNYHRRVLGILSLQTAMNLGVNCICARIGGLNDLSSNMVVFIASVVATVGSIIMMIRDPTNRHTVAKSNIMLTAFIIGSSFLTVGLTQSCNDQFTLLVLYALATAIISLFIGTLFAKNSNVDEFRWNLQIAGAAGCAVTALLVPLYLNHWYGEDYSMFWVLWTVLFNALVAWYVFYDLLEYQEESLIED